MRVILSLAACKHIAYSFNERNLRGVDGIMINSTELRLRFAHAALGDTDPMMFELSTEQLRALDMLLTDEDPRTGKLPDGTPVLGLVEIIWRALLNRNIIESPIGQQEEHEDASTNENRNADATADADAAVHQP